MKLSKLFSGLAWFLILLSVLLSIIDFCCFNRSFYTYEYQKGNTAETIQMSQEDLDDTTAVLLDYLKDGRDSLDLQKEIAGETREVFDTREKTHMKDVKELYQNALKVRNITAVAGLIFLACVLLKKKKEWFYLLETGYHGGAAALLALLTFIAIWALADFNQFWIQFHYLFFDNDLFFLDPNTEILINMVPSAFFSDLVLSIIIIFAVILTAVWIILYQIRRKRAKNAEHCAV